MEVIKYFGLTVFQVTPNGWAHMIGLFSLFMERRMGPPTAVEFAWFYSIKSKKNNEGGFLLLRQETVEGVAGHHKDQG